MDVKNIPTISIPYVEPLNTKHLSIVFVTQTGIDGANRQNEHFKNLNFFFFCIRASKVR